MLSRLAAPTGPPMPAGDLVPGRLIVLAGVLLGSLSGTIPAAMRAADPASDVSHGDDVVAAFDKAVLPFLTTHCLRCHGAERQDGELRLDELSRDVGGGPNVGKWGDVMERMNAGEMPPPEEEQRPTAEETTRVVAWMTARIAEGESARLARQEAVTFRRLSREEYANTVYDLLGVHFDVTDPTGLTEDDRWHGFERIGPALTLSASHVEKYFAAAEEVLAEAYPEKLPERTTVHKRALDLRGGPTGEMIKAMEADGRAEKVRVDIWPGHNIQGGRPGPGNLKWPGVYEVRLRVSGLRPKDGPAPHLSFYVEKLDRMLFERDIVAPEAEPTVVTFRAHLPAGSHSFNVTNDVPGPSNLPRSGRSDRRPFFSIADGRIPWQMKLTDEEGAALYPFLILDWIEWDGPIVTDAERDKRAAFMPSTKGDMGEVRTCLTRFLERAFRRPVADAEVDRYVGLVEAEIDGGADFFAAHKTAMLAALCSKDFLYLVEGSPAVADGTKGSSGRTIGDFELASRLSYFLWSTMPDEELFDLAKRGRLHEPAVLEGQVGRMLADSRSEAFARAFPGQWLQLHKVGMFRPDSKLYPDYDDHLERSMIGEPIAFFGETLAKNLSLREFIDSDWTMLNPRLARHYGVDGIDEDRFRRVSLTPDAHRGGLLTQAAILSLTSDGTRHRPVHRGVWVSETILGVTPPRPPANVDPIEPNPPTETKATLRMKLDAHKHDAQCASCHRKIDPLGLAFENYDAIGRWRTTEIVPQGVGADPPVDPSGVMPDGRPFADAVEFRELLMGDLDRFGAVFAEKLAMYALRRGLTVDDRGELEAVSAAIRGADYRVRDAVTALVLSDLFRRR